MRFMLRTATCIVIGIVASSIPMAHAAPTAGWSNSDTHAYATTIDFDSTGTLGNNTPVSSQFAAQGVQFSGAIRANSCGSNTWINYGMQNNSLGTFGPDCVSNDNNDVFSMKFSTALSSLSLDAYLFDPLHIASLDLYLKGSLVATFSMAGLAYDGLALDEIGLEQGRVFSNMEAGRAGFLKLGGGAFDELRFSENWSLGQEGFLFFDNLRFDSAATDVPEPASFGLFALGLAGIGAMRRKLKRAAQA